VSGAYVSHEGSKRLVIMALAAMGWLLTAAGAEPLPLPSVPPVIGGVPPAAGTLASAVERNPSCAERTNGCEVCIGGGEQGTLKCSLPGIACQPDGWRCTAGRRANPELSR